MMAVILANAWPLIGSVATRQYSKGIRSHHYSSISGGFLLKDSEVAIIPAYPEAFS